MKLLESNPKVLDKIRNMEECQKKHPCLLTLLEEYDKEFNEDLCDQFVKRKFDLDDNVLGDSLSHVMVRYWPQRKGIYNNEKDEFVRDVMLLLFFSCRRFILLPC